MVPEKIKNVALAIYKPSPEVKAIDIRREMLKLPEVAKALNPLEKYVFAASTKTEISEMDDATLVEKTAQLFRFIAIDVGFAIPKNESEWTYIQTRLLDILKRFYYNLTLADVKLAFEMATTGELDDFLPRDSRGNPDKNHYQQFNADYFAKILNAYKKKQNEVIGKAYNAIEAPDETPELTDEMKKQYAREAEEMTVAIYKRYCEDNLMPDDIFADITIMTAYGVLKRWGLAVELETNEDDLNRALADLRGLASSMAGVVNPYTAEHIRGDGIKHPDVVNRSAFCNRRRALQASFDKMIADKISINELTKKIK